MQETFISGMSEDNLKLLIIFGTVFGAGVITTLVVQVRKYLCYRQELEFKRELLDRGASVDEIERLIKVRASEAAGDEDDE
jgi:hypothetical protein